MKKLSISFIALLAMACFFVSCHQSKKEVIADDPTQEVPIDEVTDAPDDQKQALTEEAVPDSTELDRNYKYPDSYIYISKPKMRLYVLDSNDSVIYSCGIACGLRRGPKEAKDDYKTPEGHFSIAGMFDSTDWIHKRKDGREVKGCYGPYFLRLRTGRFTGIGIHGTNAPGSIGRRASEGCIRVNSENIVVLHDEYAYEGMPVIVSGERERLPDFKGMNPSGDQKEEDNGEKGHLKDSASHADTLLRTEKDGLTRHKTPDPSSSEVKESEHSSSTEPRGSKDDGVSHHKVEKHNTYDSEDLFE